MKKILTKTLAVVLCFAFAFSVASCGEGEKTKEDYKLSFVSAGDGYAVEIGRGGEKWSNAATGVFGVRVSYDEVKNVSDTEYAYYDQYREIDGGWLASAELQTEDGSTFFAEDTYRISDSGVEVVRTFTVTGQGSAQGFMTYYPVRDEKAGEVLAREWFAPGAYYGNDEYNFWGTGIKIGYTEEAVANVDNLSAPVIANYRDGTAFSITDRTRGYRETVVDDTVASQNSILVDEAFNIPGIGLKDVYGQGETAYVEMYHCYPANTHNYINIYPFTNNYRMLPIEENLSRETAFEIKIDDYDTFDETVESIWRDVYDEYSVVERRYAPLDVYKALTDNIYRSYGILNNVPQYMTNTDHPYTESGFLYRNADLASLMISAGYRLGKPEYIEQADTLIDYHIEKDLIVDNIVNKSERAEAEGVMAVLEAYKTHLENGVNKKDWLAYVLRKTEQKREVADPMSIPLFMRVAEYIKDDSYVDLSAEILKEFEETHKDYYYTGAIVNNSGDPIPNREAGMIYLDIYLYMYKFTGDEHYLDMAKRCEVYVESNMIIQNIMMKAEGATGYETLSDGRFRELGTVGNTQVKPYGLSWVSGQTASADNASAYCVPFVLELYELTGEEKYFEFADYVMTNSMLYVNMGDKTWLMDDIRHSSGIGFQNEYFGIAASTDTVSAGRGTMHMSNLGWNMFVVLNSLDYWADYDENFLSETKDSYDTAVLKYATASSSQSSIYRPYNAVDKRADTAWKPAADDAERTLTVDLGEFIQVKSVEVLAEGETKVFASDDGVDFTEISPAEVDGIYRYVRVQVSEGGLVKDLKVIGNPVVAKNYALGAQVTVMGAPVETMSDWNYDTVWRSSKQTDTINVDLGKIYGITEVSMLFNVNVNFSGQDYVSSVNNIPYSYKIEYSATGDEWFTYIDRSSTPFVSAVYKENVYVRARYFRITATAGTGNLTMNELKISGV